MDAPQNFRTAINGFRREDVVRYLEYLNAKHTAEVNQLSSETDTLRQQLQDLQNELSACKEVPAAGEELQQQLEAALAEKKALEEQVTELESSLTAPAEADSGAQELVTLRSENEDLKARISELEASLAASAVSQAPEKSLAEQELEAYRRAERAERIANEKADLIYHRANTILTETSGKIDGTSGELSDLADKINAQLQQMQYTINASKLAVKNAVDTLHSLHTENN